MSLPKDAEELDWNPEPEIVTSRVVPGDAEDGEREVMVSSLPTEKMPMPVLDWLSGLVTVTFRSPEGALEAMVMLTSSVLVSTNVTELMDIPTPLKATEAPASKFSPLSCTFNVEPLLPVEGLALSTLGEACRTVKAPLAEVLTPPGLVTVTLHDPRAAEGETSMLAISCEELTKVVELTVMPGLSKEMVAPSAKF